MNTKFELTSEFKIIYGVKLFRIKALVKFGNVKVGELGGYIEKESNLSVSGNAWVYGNAYVYGDAYVSENAYVSGNAYVYGDAYVSENAYVSGNAHVYGDAYVYGNAHVYGDAYVYGNAHVSGNAYVYGNAHVSGNACVKLTSDYFSCNPIGSRNASITITKSNNMVTTGCFYGSINLFVQEVKKTHGDNKYACAYLKLIELVKILFEIGGV
jgi:predicted acyltransferase (DUF342 family)